MTSVDESYKLVVAGSNGDDDLLLLKDGKVISRWSYDRLDPALKDIGDLADWDDQAAVGADLSDYQADLDAGRTVVKSTICEQGGVS